jgi:hypothetical protein
LKIVTIGNDRFRLHDFSHGLPYLVGQAEPWPLSGGDWERAQIRVTPVRTLFSEYLSLLAEAHGDEINLEELPSDPTSLALVVAATLRVPMSQKQALLTQPSVAAMLGAELAILKREKLLLDHIVQTQSEQWEGGFSGLLAKN